MDKLFYNTGIKRKEKVMKNYFIKDEALSSVDQDSFGHVDIANNIKNMIEYTDAPFNVAIIGVYSGDIEPSARGFRATITDE